MELVLSLVLLCWSSVEIMLVFSSLYSEGVHHLSLNLGSNAEAKKMHQFPHTMKVSYELIISFQIGYKPGGILATEILNCRLQYSHTWINYTASYNLISLDTVSCCFKWCQNLNKLFKNFPVIWSKMMSVKRFKFFLRNSEDGTDHA